MRSATANRPSQGEAKQDGRCNSFPRLFPTRLGSEILQNETSQNFRFVIFREIWLKFSEIEIEKTSNFAKLKSGAHCPLPTVYCPLATVHCLMSIIHCLPTVYCLPPSAHCPLSSAQFPLSTSTIYCPLFTVHYLLQTVNCPLLLPNFY
jgi:hypothetical protein